MGNLMMKVSLRKMVMMKTQVRMNWLASRGP